MRAAFLSLSWVCAGLTLFLSCYGEGSGGGGGILCALLLIKGLWNLLQEEIFKFFNKNRSPERSRVWFSLWRMRNVKSVGKWNMEE